MDSTELRSLLVDVEEEVGGFGGGNLPDAVYHVRFSATDSDNDGYEYYRLALVVRCGDGVKGKHASVFVRWFNDNPTSEGWMRKIFWGQFIKPLTTYIPDNRAGEVAAALNMLRTVRGQDDFQTAMRTLVQAVDGVDIYLHQKTKETTDPDTGEKVKDGLPNYSVIEASKRNATCVCALASVTI